MTFLLRNLISMSKEELKQISFCSFKTNDLELEEDLIDYFACLVLSCEMNKKVKFL